MLKYICFLLTEDYLEQLNTERKEIEQRLCRRQIEVLFFPLKWTGEEWAGAAKAAGQTGYTGEDTLYVTDEPEVFTQLLGAGAYVIALFHSGNREASFPGAIYAVENLAELEADSYEKAYLRFSGQPWEILETERLKVRESTVEDVEAFYRIYSHPEITRYMESLYQEHEAECAYMRAYIEKMYGFFGYGMWSVIWKESGQVIGRAGFSIREGYDLPELGFVMDVDYQRQGCGFEVCSAILKYAGEELEFEQVQALVQEENKASLGLLRKLGFVYDRDVTEADTAYKLFVINL